MLRWFVCLSVAMVTGGLYNLWNRVYYTWHVLPLSAIIPAADCNGSAILLRGWTRRPAGLHYLQAVGEGSVSCQAWSVIMIIQTSSHVGHKPGSPGNEDQSPFSRPCLSYLPTRLVGSHQGRPPRGGGLQYRNARMCVLGI